MQRNSSDESQPGERRNGAKPPPREDWTLRMYRGSRRALARNPLARMSVALPRTLGFIAQNLERRLSGANEIVPTPHLSLGLTAQVALDEAILGLAMGPSRFPRRQDYLRVGAELHACRELFGERGWLEDPSSYHRTPPPLRDPAITLGSALTPAPPFSLEHEQLHFTSGFDPRPEEPGRERWMANEPNRTGGAWVLRHRDASRPWLICIHGFGMGYPVMDFAAFGARHLHETLGLNLIFPVLPLHGHRKNTRWSGEAFLSFDLVDTIHGLTQSIWDLRRLISWARAQGGQRVGVYGVSLGAYVAALLACIEEDLDIVLTGIPVSSFPNLYRALSPHHIRLRAIEHDIIGGAAEVAHRVVSPLTMPVRPPRERRFIYAGLADRVASPAQAQALWHHWDDPEVLWYRGNHVGYLLSREVRRFVDHALTATGMVTRPEVTAGQASPAGRSGGPTRDEAAEPST